jgi:hypothetical protein
MQVQAHFRVLEPKRADHLRQYIARLGMGGGDRQSAAVGLAQFRGGAADILHFPQDARRARYDFLARVGGARQRAPLALE